MNPKVSIIIPTYNRADYLRITLQSIKNQTFHDFEVIVVDDGSPNDEANKVCAEFSFCRYLKIENSGGPAKPRNVGIDLAKGQYIAFVDDDDLWFPDKLEKQVAILNSHPDYGLVHSYCACIDENGQPTGEIVGKPGTPDIKHGNCFFKMIGNWTVMMPTPLIRRELIKQIKGFNELITPAVEDVEFFTRISRITKFWFINESLAFYRVHDANISGTNSRYKDKEIYLNSIAEDAFLHGEISKKLLLKIKKRLYVNLMLQNLSGLDINEIQKRQFLLICADSICNIFLFKYLKIKVNVKLKMRRIIKR
jgi:glycosyltransferase involved in cell wall biosynthesis